MRSLPHAPLLRGEVAERGADVRGRQHPAVGQHVLERGEEGDALEPVAQRKHARVGLRVAIVHELRDDLRPGGREAAHAPDRARVEAFERQRFLSDKHVESVEQVGLHRLERQVGDLEPGEVRRFVPQPLDHLDGDRVAASSGELVNVERQRIARVRRRPQVRQQFLGIQREVRRRDHRDRVGAVLQRVGGERHRVTRRLRAGVDRHLEPVGTLRHEALGEPPALVRRQQDALAGGAGHQHAVDTACGPEREQRFDRVQVQRPSALAQRRDGGRDRPVQLHERSLTARDGARR